jgi:hypothetical protein
MATANAQVRFQLNGSRPFSSLLEAICHLSEADQWEENVAAGRNPKPSWYLDGTRHWGDAGKGFQRYNST